MKNEVTKQIRVYGIVQGVGFRPTVSRHAATHQIRGSVSNKGPYVEIFAQGPEEAVDGFISDIENKPPKRAAILKMNIEPVEEAEDFTEFAIIESEKTKGEIFVSPDIAICDECKEEMFDPKNRRYLHPFINCTCCGPRLTILDALPYDRERTSMKEFPMCPDCAKEYYDPATRRYDAQPVCCNECGPEVYLIGREERGRDAIIYTRRTIAEGGIVAIKGIGGFHLCCDATNEEAVKRLRELKPFAVMAKDLESVKRECLVSEEQEKILSGHQKPILLLDKKEDGEETLCESIAPGNPKVGVMLPYAPVQLLLFTYDDGIRMPSFLVMTSGNTSGAPICREDKEAIQELSRLCGSDVMERAGTCHWRRTEKYILYRCGRQILPIPLCGRSGRSAHRGSFKRNDRQNGNTSGGRTKGCGMRSASEIQCNSCCGRTWTSDSEDTAPFCTYSVLYGRK